MPTREATALVIPVPEAEALVRRFRQQYDPSAAAGMPAHITLLFPFKHPHEVSDVLLDELSLLFGSRVSFHFSLAGTQRFPGVLYLAPEPAEPFRELTRAIAERYPETPPYGGAFADTVPHLTVAAVASQQELRRIEEKFCRACAGMLPMKGYACEVWLVEKREDRWRRQSSFPLAGC